MNIAFVVYQIHKHSGAAQQALKLANALVSLGVNITIYNLNDDKLNHNEKVNEITLAHVGKGQVGKACFFCCQFIRHNFDVVHFHGNFSIPFILATLLRKKTLLKSTLYGQDDFDTLSKKKFGNYYVELLKSVNINNALSNQIAASNSKYLASNKIVIIPNGVEYQVEAISFTKKENIFVFVGAIVKRKQAHISIKYFIDHYSKLENAQLYLIGPYGNTAAESDIRYFNMCKELAEPYNNKIHFTGNLDNKELTKFYKKAKGLLFFSLKEGMPNVVLEAMSFNVVPILSSMEGLSREVVTHKTNGFILDDELNKVNIEDIDILIKRMTPYTHINANFSMPNIAKRYLDTYKKMIT
ncbi:glycosyltransferase family 4 protein [Colwellia sp. E2M01]|uniref:glycosyltransferase family 4 protein n=1 Tax=Colwellia sp. E2M01 TaxID=2841561 RepID=UPI001C09B912|nr:glycosyltransferase family 4 protein [Colwellia sp. E2M01]MBU2869094.1 glycosyltransferase family 4 protein [Colwellia sp. E2M01]